MKKQKIRLTLKSYDHQLLDKAVKQIALTAKKTGTDLVGPVALPNKHRCFTVLRSPHVDKKSREHFEIRIHKRLIDILDPTPRTIDAITRIELPAGVAVEVKYQRQAL